jgi:hypothetical protein
MNQTYYFSFFFRWIVMLSIVQHVGGILFEIMMFVTFYSILGGYHLSKSHHVQFQFHWTSSSESYLWPFLSITLTQTALM